MNLKQWLTAITVVCGLAGGPIFAQGVPPGGGAASAAAGAGSAPTSGAATAGANNTGTLGGNAAVPNGGMNAATNGAAVSKAPNGAVQTGGNAQANAQTSTGRPAGTFSGGMFPAATQGGMFPNVAQGTGYPGTAQANAQTYTGTPQGNAQNVVQGVAPGSAQANAMTYSGRLPAYMQGQANNANPQGFVTANGVATIGAPGVSFSDNRPDQWRYRFDNGRWWYWTPNNTWMWYNGQQWTSFPQPGNTGPAVPSSATGLSAFPLNSAGTSTAPALTGTGAR
jgi:hypothetical protein